MTTMNQDEALSQKYLQRVTDGAGLLLPPTEGDEFLRDAGDVFPLRLRQELSEFHSLSRSTEEALVDVYDMREHEEREPLQTIFESFCRPLPDVSLTEAQIKGFAKLHHRWLSDNSETFVLFETGNGLRLADICKIVASDSSTWCMLMIVPLSVRYGAISRGPWAYNPRTQQVECVHRRVIVPRFPVTSGDWSRWEI